MADDMPPGALFAERYRIDRGAGMATVYAAEDIKHHRRVALKILHRECRAALGGERFLREIELTGNLQHPNILPLCDSGDVDGMLYYVMPLVDGHSLRARINDEGQLPIDEGYPNRRLEVLRQYPGAGWWRSTQQ